MSQELLIKAYLPFVQTAAQDVSSFLRVEAGVLNEHDLNLAYKVWWGASRLPDLVLFIGDIPWSSAQERREFSIAQFRTYLASAWL